MQQKLTKIFQERVHCCRRYSGITIPIAHTQGCPTDIDVHARTVELHEGRIIVDGVDISTIGLDTLRHQLALVPQDSTLFLGTLRENLYEISFASVLLELNTYLHFSDPQNTRTDAEIISALRRAWLLPRDDNTSDPVAEAKFSLDAPVSDEGKC